MELMQHLSAKRAFGRDAQAITAPAAAAVEQPVAADEGAARRASRGGVLRLRCRRRQIPRTGSDGSAARTAAAKSACRNRGYSAAGLAATKAEAGGAPVMVKSSCAESGSS